MSTPNNDTATFAELLSRMTDEQLKLFIELVADDLAQLREAQDAAANKRYH